jgi:hypothetical protein
MADTMPFKPTIASARNTERAMAGLCSYARASTSPAREIITLLAYRSFNG